MDWSRGRHWFHRLYLYWWPQGIQNLLLSRFIRSQVLLHVTGLVFFIAFLLYVTYGIVGWGMWKLRNWARKAAIWISLLCVPFSVLMYFVFPRQIRPPLLFFSGIAVPYLLLAWYLNRPRVRFAFGAGDGTQLGPDGQPPKLSRKGRAGVILALGAFCASVFASTWQLGQKIFQDSEIYKLAPSDANASSCVGSTIGVPVTRAGAINGNIEESGVSGSAHFQLDVTGPKGEGNLIVDGSKTNGVCEIQRLSLYKGDAETKLIPAPTTPCQ